MFGPLTRVLIKIFAKGFYQVHAGFFLFLFVSLIIYFFFIEVLNQTHLVAEQILEFNLLIVLTFVSNPIVAGILFFLWLLYAIKSWTYVSSQLAASSHQFLLYSSTSMSRAKQFASWWIVQGIILLPVAVFGLFAFIIGVLYNHYLIPLIIPFYLVLLTSVSAYLYVVAINQWTDVNYRWHVFKLISHWPKPLFSLFLYQIIDKLTLTFGITKVISWGIIAYVYSIFTGLNTDLRTEYIFVSGIVAAHSILIYQSHQFEQVYLPFLKNFPYSRIRLFTYLFILYFLLLLPEIIWVIFSFQISAGLQLAFFGISMALLLRSFLYLGSLAMGKYIPLVFGICMLLYLLILFSVTWVLVPVLLTTSFILFYFKFYR